MLKLKMCSHKIFKSLSLLMVCFVVTLSITAPVAFAEDVYYIEAEDATPIYGASLKDYNNGCVTRWFSTDGEAEWTFTATKRGNYTFSAKGNGEAASKAVFKVNGTKIYDDALNNTATWSVDENSPVTELGTVFLDKGTHTLSLKQPGVASYFLDYLSYTVVETALAITTNTEFPPSEVYDLTDDSSFIYVGDEATAIELNGTATYKGEATGEKVYRLSVMLEEPGIVGFSVNGTDYGTYNVDVAEQYCLLDTFTLPAGENTFSIYADGSTVILKNVRLQALEPGYTPDAGDGTEFTVESNAFIKDAAKYNEKTPGKNSPWQLDEYIPIDVSNGDGGKYVEAEADEWLTYEVYVPEDGVYLVEARMANGGATGTLNVTIDGTLKSGKYTNTGAYSTFADFEMATFELAQGIATVKVEFKSAGASLRKLVFKKVNTSIDVYSAFVGEKAILNNTVIPRGTDKIDVYFTNYLSEDTTNANVTLTGGGKTIPVELKASDVKLEVILNDTLDWETDYTLTVASADSKYGTQNSEPAYFTFTTGDEYDDSGLSVAELTEVSEENSVITVKGNVKSSADAYIAGRKVTVKVEYDNDVFGTYDAGLTNANGEFEYEIDISDGESGLYAVSVMPEYGTYTEPAEISYITEGDMLSALLALKDATTDDIGTWFETYGEHFGTVLLNEDGITDISKVQNRFAGKDYSNKTVFLTDYERYLILERLLQGDAACVTAILENDADCAKVGISGKKAAILITRDANGAVLNENFKVAFVNELVALDGIETVAAYQSAYDELAGNYIFESKERKIAVLDIANISAKKLQSVEIPLVFKDIQNDLTGIVVTVECTDETVISDLFVNIKKSVEATYTKTIAEDKKSAEFVIKTSGAIDSIKSLGNIAFKARKAGTYSLTVKAKALYELAGKDYDGTTNITAEVSTTLDDVQLTVSVTEPSTEKDTGGVSSFGGGGGGGSPSGNDNKDDENKENTENNENKPTDTEFGFTDIADFDWAKESIESLTEAGVISKSEDGKFNPEKAVTREEFVKMLVIALGFEADGALADFTDVDANQWYAPYIAIAKAKGITNGREDGSFGVGQQISRQDMATLAWRALEIAGVKSDKSIAESFNDDADIAEYAKASVYGMKKLGIINGVGDNNFDANGTSNRAMAAKVIYEMRKAVAK